MPTDDTAPKRGGLGVTALYTAETWGWGGIDGAELLVSPEGKRVFDGTNLALSVARPFMRDARSLPHSLLHRHAMINRLVLSSGARQILELAAGLSPRGLAVTVDPGIRYTEIDLPEVVAHKRALLERSAAGRDALTWSNLRWIAADVLEADLAEHVDRTEPALVIAEGLMMYLQRPAQVALLAKVRALLAGAGGTFVFDLVPGPEEPAPGAAGRALEWLMKRFTGGRSFEKDTRSRDDIARDVAAAGFEVEVLEPGPVAREWALPFPDEPTRMVLFVGRTGGG